MTLASLVFGDKDWLVPGIVAVVFAAILIAWAYRQALVMTSAIRAIAMGLKVLGILLLATCLVEPLWSGTRARPGANIFAVLVDNSQSLTVRDEKSDRARSELVSDLIEDSRNDRLDTSPGNWQARLEQDFDVRRYLVNTRLERVASFAEVGFDGQASVLATGLKTLRERYQNRPLAGILLFTDGNATDLTDGTIDTEGLPPIYPVVIGTKSSVRDIAVENIAVSQTAFEDAPVTIRADVVSQGYTSTTVVGQVIDANGKQVESTTLPLSDDKPASFRFSIRPEKPGVSFYTFRAAAEDELDQFEDPDSSTEATLANNSALLKVDRGDRRQRILYVAGRPNWEFKFLRRAVEGDDLIDLVGLIRIAKKEPKFEFRSRAGESSNPLFRGFKKDGDEETESYDQAVLIRLNTRDKVELRDGFPKTAEELYEYDAIILDDIEAAFFSADQQDLIERFVSERGGGFLMLGGAESFPNGGYLRTPIGKLLPVYLDRLPELQTDTRWQLALTRDGWLQPWIRLRKTEPDERERLKTMPAFQSVNRIGAIKPGSIVMASVNDERGDPHPALIVQRYGRGRAAALTIGDLWRWRLRDTTAPEGTDADSMDKSDQAKAWRQMVRWLVADVPERVQAEVEPEPDVAAHAVRIAARIRDPEFKPLDNASVTISVKPDSGDAIKMTAEPSEVEAGVYLATFVPRERDAYRVDVKADNEDGEEVGTTEDGWTTDPAAVEFQSTQPNLELLEKLAEDTGGELITASDIGGFVQSLPSRKVPIKEQWTYPLWHQAWVFLIAIGCFVSEWGLRRWRGLP